MSGNERIASSEAQDIPPACPAHHEGDTEVVVVGAGPAGLTAAAIVAGYGIRTVVLDRAAFPCGRRTREDAGDPGAAGYRGGGSA